MNAEMENYNRIEEMMHEKDDAIVNLTQAVNDKDLELFESQELVAALLDTLARIADIVHVRGEFATQLCEVADMATEAIRKANQ